MTSTDWAMSPKDQDLISTLENSHVTLAEFQRRHGLEPDGIMGVRTKKVIADLAYIGAASSVGNQIQTRNGISYIDTRAPLNSSKPKLTFESEEVFRKFVQSLTYTVRRNRMGGWETLIPLPDGCMWRYWRPFKSWAERVGSKRLLREVETLEFEHGFMEQETFSLTSSGVSSSSDQLTEELYEAEVKERWEALSDWESAFQQTEDTVKPSTDVVVFEDRKTA